MGRIEIYWMLWKVIEVRNEKCKRLNKMGIECKGKWYDSEIDKRNEKIRCVEV